MHNLYYECSYIAFIDYGPSQIWRLVLQLPSQSPNDSDLLCVALGVPPCEGPYRTRNILQVTDYQIIILVRSREARQGDEEEVLMREGAYCSMNADRAGRNFGILSGVSGKGELTHVEKLVYVRTVSGRGGGGAGKGYDKRVFREEKEGDWSHYYDNYSWWIIFYGLFQVCVVRVASQEERRMAVPMDEGTPDK